MTWWIAIVFAATADTADTSGADTGSEATEQTSTASTGDTGAAVVDTGRVPAALLQGETGGLGCVHPGSSGPASLSLVLAALLAARRRRHE